MTANTNTNDDLDPAILAAARTHAYESFLVALLSPKHVRNDLVVLSAFLGETERIPFLVSEPTLGAIRLQWWRDWLDGLTPSQPATGNPLADQFAEVIARQDLSKTVIGQYLDARAEEAYAGVMGAEKSFERHILETVGVGLQLRAKILLSSDNDKLAGVLNNAAKAIGTILTFKRLPKAVAHTRWPLPTNESPPPAEKVFLPEHDALRARSVEQARNYASAAYERAKADVMRENSTTRLAVLELALVEPYLRVLHKPGFDPTREKMSLLPLTVVWRLWRAKITGRI